MAFILESQPLHYPGSCRYLLFIKICPGFILSGSKICLQRPGFLAVKVLLIDPFLYISPFLPGLDPEIGMIRFHLYHDLCYRRQPVRLNFDGYIVRPFDQLFPSAVLFIFRHLISYVIDHCPPFFFRLAVLVSSGQFRHHSGFFEQLLIDIRISAELLPACISHDLSGVRPDISLIAIQSLCYLIHVQPVIDRCIDHIRHAGRLSFDRFDQGIRHQVIPDALLPLPPPVLLDRDCRQLITLQRFHLAG